MPGQAPIAAFGGPLAGHIHRQVTTRKDRNPGEQRALHPVSIGDWDVHDVPWASVVYVNARGRRPAAQSHERMLHESPRDSQMPRGERVIRACVYADRWLQTGSMANGPGSNPCRSPNGPGASPRAARLSWRARGPGIGGGTRGTASDAHDDGREAKCQTPALPHDRWPEDWPGSCRDLEVAEGGSAAALAIHWTRRSELVYIGRRWVVYLRRSRVVHIGRSRPASTSRPCLGQSVLGNDNQPRFLSHAGEPRGLDPRHCRSLRAGGASRGVVAVKPTLTIQQPARLLVGDRRRGTSPCRTGACRVLAARGWLPRVPTDPDPHLVAGHPWSTSASVQSPCAARGTG